MGATPQSKRRHELPGGVGRLPEAIRFVPVVVSLLLAPAATFLAYRFFSLTAAAAAVALWVLAALNPKLAVAILFLIVSIDWTRPVFGVFLDLSELELAACLLGFGLGIGLRREPIDWRPLCWGAPFAAAVLISALANSEWLRVVPHFLRLSELLVALWLAANALGAAAKGLLQAVIASATGFYCLCGLAQFESAPLGRVSSLFDNPNQFAAYLNLLLPFLLVFLLSDEGSKVVWVGLLGLILISSLAAQSRAALLAGALAVATVILLAGWSVREKGEGGGWRGGRPWRGRRWRSVAAAAAGLVLLVWMALSLASDLLPGLQLWKHELEARSSGGLISDWNGQRGPFAAVGLEVWKENPWLGVGPGNYPRAVRRHWDLVESFRGRTPDFESFKANVILHPHNLYLQIGGETGVAGLAGFLFLLACLVREFIRLRESPWSLAGLGLLAAFVTHNLFDSTFPSLRVETGLALGMALALGRSQHERISKPIQSALPARSGGPEINACGP